MSICEVQYEMVNLKQKPELREKDIWLNNLAFPEFVLHDKLLTKHWQRLKDIYPDHQWLMIKDRNVLATINTFPLHYPVAKLSKLPHGGVRWVVTTSLDNHLKNKKPNIVAGGLVSINPEFKNKGISHAIVTEMKRFSKAYNYEALIIPLRPSLKKLYPLTPIKNYMNWKTNEGLAFDPWLRAHVKQGAQIIRHCLRSSITENTIEKWEEWTNMKYPEDGTYVVQGGLSPLTINHAKKLGTYIEPNIWISHQLQ